MLDPAEEAAVAGQFGVARPQVRRDHLISHLLAALSARAADHVVFFGGTALSRTFLPDGRLSEDIDLIAVHERRPAAEVVADCLVRGVRREYPGLRWEPRLTDVRDTEPAVLVSPEGLTVRVQLLGATGYPPWPTERREIVQRYSDAPPATLAVLTLPAFVAAKTIRNPLAPGAFRPDPPRGHGRGSDRGRPRGVRLAWRVCGFGTSARLSRSPSWPMWTVTPESVPGPATGCCRRGRGSPRGARRCRRSRPVRG